MSIINPIAGVPALPPLLTSADYTKDGKKKFNTKELQRQIRGVIQMIPKEARPNATSNACLQRFIATSNRLSKLLTYIDSPAFPLHPYLLDVQQLPEIRYFSQNEVLHNALDLIKRIQDNQKTIYRLTLSADSPSAPLYTIAHKIEHVMISRIIQSDQLNVNTPSFSFTSRIYFNQFFAFCTFFDSQWQSSMAFTKTENPLSVHFITDYRGEQLFLDDNKRPFQEQGIALYNTAVVLDSVATDVLGISYYSNPTGGTSPKNLSFSIQENPDNSFAVNLIQSPLLHLFDEDSLGYIEAHVHSFLKIIPRYLMEQLRAPDHGPQCYFLPLTPSASMRANEDTLIRELLLENVTQAMEDPDHIPLLQYYLDETGLTLNVEGEEGESIEEMTLQELATILQPPEQIAQKPAPKVAIEESKEPPLPKKSKRKKGKKHKKAEPLAVAKEKESAAQQSAFQMTAKEEAIAEQIRNGHAQKDRVFMKFAFALLKRRHEGNLMLNQRGSHIRVDASRGNKSTVLVRVHKGGRKESIGSLHFQKRFLNRIERALKQK